MISLAVKTIPIPQSTHLAFTPEKVKRADSGEERFEDERTGGKLIGFSEEKL